jgi:hypothetical protein
MTQWGLDSLFNPAKRHMDEEKRRLQATREEIGDSSGGKRIDLESGKVKIRKADGKATAVKPDELEEPEESETAEEAEVEASQAEEPEAEAEVADEENPAT